MDRTEGINDSTIRGEYFNILLSVIHRKIRQKINNSSLEQHNRLTAPNTSIQNSSWSNNKKQTFLKDPRNILHNKLYVTKLYVRPQNVLIFKRLKSYEVSSNHNILKKLEINKRKLENSLSIWKSNNILLNNQKGNYKEIYKISWNTLNWKHNI